MRRVGQGEREHSRGGQRAVRRPDRDYGEGEADGGGRGAGGSQRARDDMRGRQDGWGEQRVIQTTAERLRREAGIRHPDTRLYKTGVPMATLQHILTGCAGLREGGKVRAAMVEALRGMEEAVPLEGTGSVPHNRAFRKVVHEARMCLQAGDVAALSEQRWARLEEVIAGCVPDFGRHKGEKERRAMVRAVVGAVQQVQGEVAWAVET